LTALAPFNGTNGVQPVGGVTFDANGNLFGTATVGGASNNGTVWELAKGSSTITPLASFNGTNGASPQAGVTFDANGNLFSTAEFGGAGFNGTPFSGNGTVWELSPVPEPSSLVQGLIGFALAGAAALLKRHRRESR
jgi:uncharacterized repeat protein (TIGR03803 family)